MRGESRVAVAFFGDGATNIGTFHEALNLAQLWKVPALFVCENNRWAESTPASQQLAIEDLTKRADAYGMDSVRLYGQDVEEVYRQAVRAVERVREGRPLFFLCDTYRLHGHYIGDPQVYRSKEDIADARDNHDPLELARRQVELSDDDLEAMEAEVAEIVEHAVEFAKNGTDPDPEDALQNVYA
jgi:pyruvate dehydrogenase E1 component alpha subunit